jgi:2-methylcitrate dehydratase PrpD
MGYPVDTGVNRRLLVGGAAALGAASSLAGRARAQVAAEAVGAPMAALSAYMAAAPDRALPAEVTEKAKHHILDTFAAMISGSQLTPGQAAITFARGYGGAPVATVVASDVLCGPIEAALTNGLLAHSDETDDSDQASQSHPGSAVVPAALATGERFGMDGEHFIRAVTLGYDVGSRVTIAMGGVVFRQESHRATHAIAGGFGAAAAAGAAARLDQRQMRWLLDYAGQQSSGVAAWERDQEHIEKGFVFAGMGARSGVTAALLVKSGWTGIDDIFSGESNFFQAYAPKADVAQLTAGLGQRFEIAQTDIKKWTVGSPIQAPLDALDLLIKRYRFKATDVRDLRVRLAPNEAAVVDARDMPDISLQHMITVMLIDGTASFAAAHDRPRMQAKEVLAVRARVHLVPDPELSKALPARPAIVEVTLNDGRTLSQRVDAVRGTAANPMTRQEVVDKARDLTAPVLGPAQADALIQALLTLETQADIRALRPLLQAVRRG